MAVSQSSIAAALLAFAVGVSGPLALAPGKTTQSQTEAASTEPTRADPPTEPNRIVGALPLPWGDPKSQRDAPAPQVAPQVSQPQPERTVAAAPEPASASVPAASPRKAQARPRYRLKRYCRCKVVRSRRRD